MALLEGLDSFMDMFADDTKVMRAVKNLQRDLNELHSLNHD